MTKIRCPHCGSPVRLRGQRWECTWCGDFGSLASLSPTQKAKLLQSAYIGPPQEDLIRACTRLGQLDLQQNLLALLDENTYPHDPVQLD